MNKKITDHLAHMRAMGKIRSNQASFIVFYVSSGIKHKTPHSEL